MSYHPRPTVAVPTGMHQVIPNRNPSVVGVRSAFEQTFGGYVPAEWTLDAECTSPNVDPGLFFPRRGGRSTAQTALAACAVCVVQEKCLADAIEFEIGDVGADDVRPEVHGIRGGMVEKERRRLVQQARVQRRAEKRDAVVADYLAGGMSYAELTAKHGISDDTLRKWTRSARRSGRGGA